MGRNYSNNPSQECFGVPSKEAFQNIKPETPSSSSTLLQDIRKRNEERKLTKRIHLI